MSLRSGGGGRSWSGTQYTSFLIMVNSRMYVFVGSLKILSAMKSMIGNSGATMLSMAIRMACTNWTSVMKYV